MYKTVQTVHEKSSKKKNILKTVTGDKEMLQEFVYYFCFLQLC